MSQPKGCLLGWLFTLLGDRPPASAPPLPNVMPNKFFITDAERAFFLVLRQVTGTRAHILAQVSLKQLLYLPGSNTSNPGRSTWQNKINQRSLDFLLLHPQTLRPPPRHRT